MIMLGTLGRGVGCALAAALAGRDPLDVAPGSGRGDTVILAEYDSNKSKITVQWQSTLVNDGVEWQCTLPPYISYTLSQKI